MTCWGDLTKKWRSYACELAWKGHVLSLAFADGVCAVLSAMPPEGSAQLWGVTAEDGPACVLCVATVVESFWPPCLFTPASRKTCASIMRLHRHSSMVEVVKPAVDKLRYRCVVLDNQIRMTLVSDPEADKAAAAMDVRLELERFLKRETHDGCFVKVSACLFDHLWPTAHPYFVVVRNPMSHLSYRSA